jgi:membrane-associated HD superfamily phosphohydrolase
MKEHDKDSIDKKVDQIIDDKIGNNQFRNCNLTFGDIDRIRKILKSKMMSIYHARIAYPVTK